MKTKIIPFDLETAKKIQAGEIKGKIVTNNGYTVRIICFDKRTSSGYPILGLVDYPNQSEMCKAFNVYGLCYGQPVEYVLQIELPEETPNQKGELTLGKCKEGDEVWIYSNYEYGPEYVKVKVGKLSLDTSSGHRRNVTFENGFTCQELVSQTCWYENPEGILTDNSFYEKLRNTAEILATPKHEFKPFDKVLVRDAYCEVWRPDIFSSMVYSPLYSCLRSDWHYCIPYEGNEHLVGTTVNPK